MWERIFTYNNFCTLEIFDTHIRHLFFDYKYSFTIPTIQRDIVYQKPVQKAGLKIFHVQYKESSDIFRNESDAKIYTFTH